MNVLLWLVRFASVCVMMLSIPVFSQSSELRFIEIDRVDFNHRATSSVLFLTDEARSLTFEEIQSKHSAFQYFDQHTLQFGYTQSATWLRLDIRNSLKQVVNVKVSLQNTLLDKVDFYYVDRQGVVIHQQAGDHIPIPERQNAAKHFFEQNLLEPGDHWRLFIRIESENAQSLPLYVSTQEGFLGMSNNAEWVDGCYYGLALAMLVYNLLLLIHLREQIYLEYMLCVLFQMTYIAAISGYMSVLFPFNHFIIEKMAFIIGGCMTAAFIQFTRSFLRIKEEYPGVDRFYYFCIGLALGMACLLPMLPTQLAHKLNALLGISTVLILFPVALTRYLSGFKLARYFVIGQAVFLGAVIFSCFSILNILPLFYLAPLIIKIASGVELLFFSLCLADRISEFKKREFEYLKAQKLAEQEAILSEQHIAEMGQINRDLELALQTRSEFLANMSHEIRTPMNGILGMLELIDSPSLDSVQRNYIEIARRSGKTLLELINGVLDLSKIDSGNLELDEQPFSLREFTNDLSSLYRRQIEDKQLSLRVMVDPSVPDWIMGDRTRIWQVLTNLISNAVKFTQKGGIVIRVNRLYLDQNRIQFSIIDTGIGIAKEKQDLIFESFKQADGSTTRKYGGTGLGLSISRKLVGLLGGKLEVISSEGAGSEFRFSIPCQIAEREQLQRSEPNPPKIQALPFNCHHLRVLLVEDNPVNQKVALGVLKKLGVEQVQVANDGLEAISFFSEERVDLVFMDIQMPNMDGFQATKRIRELEGCEHHTPIIAMTANSMDGDRERCLNGGLDDYISKPIKIDVLKEVIRRYASPPLSRDEADSA